MKTLVFLHLRHPSLRSFVHDSNRWRYYRFGRQRRPSASQCHQDGPQLSTITPRWLTHLLQWVPVEAGIYRVNQVKNPEDIKVTCTAKQHENQLPRTYVDYDAKPREYFLNAVSTVLDVHTRISDLYSSPHDQIKEQLRLTIETIKENQESELINNPDYGLLAQVGDEQRIFPLTGAPTVPGKASVLSFTLEGYTTEEVGKALNAEGIAVRTGHHCAQPILRRFGVETAVRPSLAFYNTFEEIDQLVTVVRRLASQRR